MQINHLIDGKTVTGRDYFETVNPATQEVLAEVAAGGEAEVNAAVAAAKAAFPAWAGTPAPQRVASTRWESTATTHCSGRQSAPGNTMVHCGLEPTVVFPSTSGSTRMSSSATCPMASRNC